MKELLKKFIRWYEYSGYSAFDLYEYTDKIIEEFLKQKAGEDAIKASDAAK